MPERGRDIYDLIDRMHRLEALVFSLQQSVRASDEARQLAKVAADHAHAEAQRAHAELEKVRRIADSAVKHDELAYRKRIERWLLVAALVAALVYGVGFAALWQHTNQVETAQRAYIHQHCLDDNQALDAQRQLDRDFIAAIKAEEGSAGARRIAAWQRALDALPVNADCDVPG